MTFPNYKNGKVRRKLHQKLNFEAEILKPQIGIWPFQIDLFLTQKTEWPTGGSAQIYFGLKDLQPRIGIWFFPSYKNRKFHPRLLRSRFLRDRILLFTRQVLLQETGYRFLWGVALYDTQVLTVDTFSDTQIFTQSLNIKKQEFSTLRDSFSQF